MATLRIDKYEISDEIWYDPKYSWYCTGYSKTKEETGKAISEKFTFLRKNKSSIVNVNPINLTLAKHRIILNKLRKIEADHASRIHGGRNDSHCQYLRKLACRQVIGYHKSVESYGIMNDPPSCNCSKAFQNQVKIKEKVD
ncbi:hypothetical protein GLOIN_2v1876937 [Rhizophagus clarus]|uniref:Uncharacterized protein n=1 Tax=Rhizophagus clarus TaxID=94130 RepID=A0A8H3R0K7_9GLOM|nr:hypothetical protein GLOIN_2v1876937 [Rhizophagus clarus]